eukprot:s1676_g2.t4
MKGQGTVPRPRYPTYHARPRREPSSFSTTRPLPREDAAYSHPPIGGSRYQPARSGRSRSPPRRGKGKGPSALFPPMQVKLRHEGVLRTVSRDGASEPISEGAQSAYPLQVRRLPRPHKGDWHSGIEEDGAVGETDATDMAEVDGAVSNEGEFFAGEMAEVDGSVGNEGELLAAEMADADGDVGNQGEFFATEEEEIDGGVGNEGELFASKMAEADAGVSNEGEFAESDMAEVDGRVGNEGEFNAAEMAEADGGVGNEGAADLAASAKAAPAAYFRLPGLPSKPVPAGREWQEGDPTNRIAIGGIPQGTDAMVLGTFFSTFGEVRCVDVPSDSGGAAFIEFARAAEAEAACSCPTGLLLEGIQLDCQLAPPEEEEEADASGQEALWVAASVLAQSRVASSCRDLVMFAVTVFVGFFFSSLDVRGLEETEKNQAKPSTDAGKEREKSKVTPEASGAVSKVAASAGGTSELPGKVTAVAKPSTDAGKVVISGSTRSLLVFFLLGLQEKEKSKAGGTSELPGKVTALVSAFDGPCCRNLVVFLVQAEPSTDAGKEKEKSKDFVHVPDPRALTTPDRQFFSKGKGKKGFFGKGKGKAPNSSDLDEPKLFVGSLPAGSTEEELKKHFEEKFGQVSEMRLIYNELNEFRGFGFVTFKDLDVARSVLDNYETNTFLGAWIDCKVPINTGEEQRKWKRHAETSVSLQKLPPTVTEAALKNYFQAYGKICKVTLLAFAGAAEVTFDSASSANSCLRSAPHLFEGEAIEVDLVQPPAASKSRRTSNGEDAQELQFPEDVFLRVSGLPPEKQQPDVFKLFYHFSLARIRELAGEAIVEFTTHSECVRAFRDKQGGRVGCNRVTLSAATREDFQQLKAAQEAIWGGRPFAPPSLESCLRHLDVLSRDAGRRAETRFGGTRCCRAARRRWRPHFSWADDSPDAVRLGDACSLPG